MDKEQLKFYVNYLSIHDSDKNGNSIKVLPSKPLKELIIATEEEMDIVVAINEILAEAHLDDDEGDNYKLYVGNDNHHMTIQEFVKTEYPELYDKYKILFDF